MFVLLFCSLAWVCVLVRLIVRNVFCCFDVCLSIILSVCLVVTSFHDVVCLLGCLCWCAFVVLLFWLYVRFFEYVCVWLIVCLFVL